ncbi:Heat shock protein. Metallo peptidase. MEROPS family M48B [Methanosarcina thermophila]|jgi:heat shock protein HtpX|uniref:Protease HtpX homolog n=3 Tax=Methanosarcina thermophila TaxID=2210 RepID=A0A1I7AD19_METTE|nr:zinc metalloprotease HtpX [Methanosarcina thermophila]ALK06206.1 MAG: heat shock protein HtpX [Methanosarcina sp. 795]NLU57303.1 zinc metalloprotease HtpX [Methanosarcina thermophila]SFT72821.1 Heat shock protein. Metallo peptidase. MEROPS family M48B [Methanosarcina thermophila]BAW29861.1 heat shock protein, Metallo peptidase, MEROPS family M48B [Methanosarcina thermophila]GLI14246.1 heat-shock protein HtpX [Methanosarcina thermophila MST-A1]
MKRKWERDLGLQGRMIFTMFLLAAVYLFFLAFLSYYGTPPIFMLLFVGSFMAIQYFYSDKLVLMSSGARVVSESEAPQLHGMITRLCAIADLPKPQVAIVRSQIPNAFATGRNRNKAVVAVTTGIMDKLSPAELEAVLAHELSHIKNRDMAVMTIASFISTLAFYFMRYSIYFGGMGGGDRRRDGGGIILIWLVSIAVWIVSFLLIRALSRYREYAADRGSAIITGQPSVLASALMKISGIMERIPSQDLRSVEGMNAFFTVPAISGSSIMDIFSTHPSVEKRIARLEKMQQKMI